MSKIEELIQKYCPDGVEYKRFGDIATLEKGKGLQKTDFTDEGIGCIHYGQIYTHFGISTTETLTCTSAEKAKKFTVVHPGDIVMASTSENVEDCGKSVVWLGSDDIVTGGHSIVIRTKQNPMYLAYVLQTPWFQKQKVKKVYGVKVIEFKPDELADIVIPVPPLPVQQEIVRILDSFTSLQDELQKELEERKSQIRLLLNSMMQFPMAEEKPIGELLSVCRGASPRPISKYIVPSGIHWIKIGDVKPGEKYITDTEQFVSQDGAKKSRLVKPGDLIMSNSMSYGRPYIMKISGCIHDGWLLVSNYEDSYTTEFLYYLLRSDRVQKQFSKKASSGTVSNLNADIVRSVQVPVPTFEEQNAIVEKLSIFDEYNTAVKKEIMFRQQQYTYYRDKLLSFPRKEV